MKRRLVPRPAGAPRLTSRRKRMAIGIAGVTAELGLAFIATFLWSFLPDGALRSAAFLVATTTWVGASHRGKAPA